METKSGTRFIYKEFIKRKTKITGFDRWFREIEVEYEDWVKSSRILLYTTKDTKLRWLHFRIIHHILTTNRSVSKYIMKTRAIHALSVNKRVKQ